MSSRRDHLVNTATQLFSTQGFRATGIDAVLAAAGVAKKTLYNHFRSKDELIIATLQKRDADFMDNARAGVARLAPQQEGDPRMARVLALFEALAEWTGREEFYGCAFINASAEYPRREDPIHVACANHKKLVVQYLEELLSELPLADPRAVAKQLDLLIEGAVVRRHTAGDTTSMLLAKETARQLLDGHLQAQAASAADS